MAGQIPATPDGDGTPETECPTCEGTGGLPGIFHAFRPTAIEYVTRGDETAEEIEALDKRGTTPVKVELAEEGTGRPYPCGSGLPSEELVDEPVWRNSDNG